MDLLEYYTHCTSVAIMRSVELFDDETLFGSLKEKKVYGILREENKAFGSVEEERRVNDIYKYT